ncbi:MAG: VapC toxin family domain ribonuclease [Verrucomicrobiales bacterium]|nr:VapC toxin family domain ribonuclease [Verrucomicrobiales bacterium]
MANRPVNPSTQTVVFIDTNLLLYAASDGKSDPKKKVMAEELIAARPFVVSMQVVQEFHVAATKKIALGISSEHAAKVLEALVARVVVHVTPELFREAVVLQSRFCLSYWDAAIVAAAGKSGCKLIFSEDMGHLQIYDRVMVANPIADEGRWISENPPSLARLK